MPPNCTKRDPENRCVVCAEGFGAFNGKCITGSTTCNGERCA